MLLSPKVFSEVPQVFSSVEFLIPYLRISSFLCMRMSSVLPPNIFDSGSFLRLAL